MESICKAIQSGNEESVITALLHFNETNKAKFQLGESPASRKVFCSTALALISGEQNEGTQWSLRSISLTLHALRIFAREFEGVDQLVSKKGLKIIATLAQLSTDMKGEVFDQDGSGPLEERVEVIVEAVKLLCNIVLNNRHLTPLAAEIGCLEGLSHRLNLSHTKQLPHDVLFFDLRLLFLITACGPVERETFRDACNGLSVLINVVDSVLFGPSQHTSSPLQTELAPVVDVPTKEVASKLGCENSTEQTVKNGATATLVQFGDPHLSQRTANMRLSLAPLRDSVYCMSRPVTDQQCSLLCEALKIIFNQTLNWKDEDKYNEDDLCIWSHICHLLKIIILSVSPLKDKLASDTISHCTEVLVNSPEQYACKQLLPPEIQIIPTLSKLHSDLYQDFPSTAANVEEVQSPLLTTNLDCIHEGWNMAVLLALVNYLDLLLRKGSDRPGSISSVLISLRILSKGHRCIRRFLRSLILPPLKEVKARPNEGDTLKSRIISLMTAGSQGAEEVTADLLFVLCKENVTRFVKYTGFGNAAGLLLSRGLLGGGKSKGEVLYSSDSEPSDTEEYDQSRDKIDPVTGGLSKGAEPSPLDHMTEEEKEIEAEKLAVLLDQLNRYGVIKALPVNKDGEVMRESSDED